MVAVSNIRLSYGFIIGILSGLSLLAIVWYLLPLFPSLPSFLVQHRLGKLLAYMLVAAGVSFATISFQTLVGTSFLTPSILGLESFYVLLQSLYFMLHWRFVSQEQYSPVLQFVILVLLQCLLFGLLQPAVKKLLSQGFVMILLICMALGTLFRSSSTFLQVLMDPNEYDQLQARLFPSFQRLSEDLLFLVLPLIILLVVYFWRKSDVLDLLHLGKETATVLGLDVLRQERQLLWGIVICQAAVTALIGPLAYLGFMVSNLTYLLLKTYRHRQLFLTSSLLAFVFLIFGQMLVEDIFRFDIHIGMLIELGGGIFFFYLICKERQLS